MTASIESRDGHSYSVAELVDAWELDDDILEVYRRPPDDPAYQHSESW